jgi:hypothetical protein
MTAWQFDFLVMFIWTGFGGTYSALLKILYPKGGWVLRFCDSQLTIVVSFGVAWGISTSAHRELISSTRRYCCGPAEGDAAPCAFLSGGLNQFSSTS